MEQRTCAVCAGSFTAVQPSKIYCSPRCKNSGGAALRKARNATKTVRRCYRCSEVKPAAEFSSASQSYCRPCQNEYQRSFNPSQARREKRLKWRRENEFYSRPRRVYYLYGISPERYQSLLEAQSGRCAICGAAEPGGRWKTWHIDHDHRHCAGKRACEECVRGLLCQGCNLGLGYFRDNPKILSAALRYLAENPVDPKHGGVAHAHDHIECPAPEE